MLPKLLGRIGTGLLAGLAGTALMTLGQRLEIWFTGRPPSDTPARIAERLTGIAPSSDRAERRLGTVTHWAYGTLWGLVAAGLRRAGLRGLGATAAHAGLMWLVALVLVPATKVAPPVRRWGARAIGIDLLHHVVYGLGVSTVLGLLEREAPPVVAQAARQARWAMREPAPA